MEIITRYSGLKSRAREIRAYISDISSSDVPSGNIKADFPEIELANRVQSKIASCANFLVFHNYYTIDQTKLVKTFTCKQHLVCPFCAARRAAKNMAAYSEKITQVTTENPTLKPVMLTLTVKNGSDLQERFLHLKKALQRLTDRRRDYLKKGYGKTEFRKIDGAMYSVEFTYNPDSGWHPHIHMLALIHDWIDREALSNEWEEVTGDSKIIDVRLIKNRSLSSDSDLSSGLSEVLKYALKFSDLSNERVWEAYKTLRTKRLMATFGSLWGVKIPESLLDDPLENLPYLELFYKFNRSSNQYDLREATPCPPAATADSGEDCMENPTPPNKTPVKGKAAAKQRCEAPLTAVLSGGVNEPMQPPQLE